MACILNKVPVLYQAVLRKNLTSTIKITKACGYFTNNRLPIKVEQRFKLQDNITNDYSLVYRDQKILAITWTICYNFGWIGFIFSILSIMHFYIYSSQDDDKKIEIENLPKNINLTNTRRKIVMFTSVILFVILILASKIFPFRIYYNSKTELYKAVLASNVLRRSYILTYSKGTVVPLFKQKEFASDALYNINGHIIIFDRECFVTQSIYEQMFCKVH